MVDIRRRHPSPTLLWWFGTGTLAAVLLAVTFVVTAAAYDVPVLVAFVAGTAQAVSLPLAVARPMHATALQFGSVIAFSVTAPVRPEMTWPLPIPGMIALILFVGVIAARHSWRAAVVIWWGSVLLLILLALLDPRGRTIEDAGTALVLYITNSVLLVIAAMVLRHGSGIRRQLAEARRDIAVEQSQRAVVEERTRIARELHDVVAHSMSVIHMQATSASYRIKDIDPESRGEFARIAAGARSTMREMRQLLALLRDENADPSLAPVPGLDRLEELVESTRQAGVPVELSRPDEVDVPDTVGTTAYRIVQESLSNVIRHAPGARTRVVVDLTPGALKLEVVNEPPGEPPGAPAAPGGHGLHGMRERVRLVGGSLETGPAEAGGYRVYAKLPRSAE
ncbi:two-component sensor histidine kinase [Acrocarpospora pleiomorpha]|uniref:histidine kinase n=1 Tax=Acrocarpospora pleiomorpha TaxID=90975 RepID=A0A5M3Y499_9ACTN|nr:histidine kinase [Acrocarpospora pleiomorpha]GES26983.1 two-component sensor histidine kinase [Acrocarpospora pleiomorpha]